MLAQSSGQSVAAVGMGLLTALGGFYLAWKAFQQDRDQVTAMSLGTAVDQLAEAVKKQWDAEASVRRLNDPYPLPVAWRAADADLVQPWTLLADVARGWPGGPPVIPPNGLRMPPGWRALMRRSVRCLPSGYPPAAWSSSAIPAPANPCCSSACSTT